MTPLTKATFSYLRSDFSVGSRTVKFYLRKMDSDISSTYVCAFSILFCINLCSGPVVVTFCLKELMFLKYFLSNQ